MRFSPWFRRANGTTTKHFRPGVCVLEDRTVPTAFRIFPTVPTGFRILPTVPTGYRILPTVPLVGPISHFQVIAPAEVQPGTAFNLVVKAEDAGNHVVSGYRGTIHFTLGAPDLSATLPAGYTFVATDQGTHTFHVKLEAAGSQVIVATGPGGITGSAVTTVGASSVMPGATDHLVILTPTTVTAGVPTTVTVEVLGVSNQVATGSSGTVQLSSSDGSTQFGSLVSPGVFQFTVLFNSPGLQTLSATDTGNGAMANASVSVMDSWFSPFGGSMWNPYGYSPWGYGYSPWGYGYSPWGWF